MSQFSSLFRPAHWKEQFNQLNNNDYFVILSMYLLSYELFSFCFGGGFYEQNLFSLWQYLDPAWLAHDLGRSLLYLHAQPPLMNLVIGIIFKISAAHHALLFRFIYALAGIGALACINRTMEFFSVSRKLRLSLIALTCFTPSFHTFGTWYAYTHFEFCLFAAGLYWLVAFYHAPGRAGRPLCKAFAMFALLGLLRSQWHLVVFLALLAMMLAVERRGYKRTVMLAGLILILPLGAWYGKNQLLFGFFGPSSWAGSNLAMVTAYSVPPERIATYKKQGSIGSQFPVNFNMPRIVGIVPPAAEKSAPDAYALPYKTSAPYPNMNYYGIIATARQDMHDALFILRQNPLAYVSYTLKRMGEVSMEPAAFFAFYYLPDIRSLIPYWTQYLWQIAAILFYVVSPFYATAIGPRENRRLLLMLLAFSLMMLAIACAFDGYDEQVRMRWGWQAVYILFAAISLENLRKRWHEWRHG